MATVASAQGIPPPPAAQVDTTRSNLYARAGQIVDAVGAPETLVGRFAHWCLADIYRHVAEYDGTSPDDREAALAKAAEHETLAPEPEEYEPAGYATGQRVAASLGVYGSCTTHIR